jgi:hypothetical protein
MCPEFTNKVKVHLNELGAIMKTRISSYIRATHVVTINKEYKKSNDYLKNTLNPNDFGQLQCWSKRG